MQCFAITKKHHNNLYNINFFLLQRTPIVNASGIMNLEARSYNLKKRWIAKRAKNSAPIKKTQWYIHGVSTMKKIQMAWAIVNVLEFCTAFDWVLALRPAFLFEFSTLKCPSNLLNICISWRKHTKIGPFSFKSLNSQAPVFHWSLTQKSNWGCTNF
jgi:hypothetical protein